MKFPSYELLNKYAILHFRNVIHVDYSIILTSSGWPFARDQQVMSSKIKGQDHHCTAWRRIVVVETTLFALSHFDGISRIFFQPQFLRVNELITNRLAIVEETTC